jgi:hypothetical protein
MLSRLLKQIDSLRTRALRNKVWFLATEKTERAIVSLSLRCLQTVRERSLLAKVLSVVVAKVQTALESGRQFLFEVAGRPIAQLMVRTALKWGYEEGKEWLKDITFIRFHGLNRIGSSSTFSSFGPLGGFAC